MTDMIERVAQAIFAKDPEGMFSIHYARVYAKAAILAMREPTETMIDAGSKEQRTILSKPIEGIWTAMIDDALEDE